MKIVEITRTISGTNYDNVCARAMLSENEDPIMAACELDEVLQKALSEIDNMQIIKAESQHFN